MSVLTKHDIWKALNSDEPSERLVLTPLLSEDQIRESSVDIRLGFEFVLFNRSLLRAIDPGQHHDWQANIHRYQQRIRVARRNEFVLHPRQLVLAATMEYVGIPADLVATVCGRSTWGRTGLVIATATMVAPGFKGCITLELINDGLIPIVLHPGDRIAQIIFETTEMPVEYSGRYRYPTGPSFPDFSPDEDSDFWTKSNDASDTPVSSELSIEGS